MVDDPEMPDPGGGEIERDRGAEAAGADDRDLGVEQPLLTFLTDLR